MYKKIRYRATMTRRRVERTTQRSQWSLVTIVIVLIALFCAAPVSQAAEEALRVNTAFVDAESIETAAQAQAAAAEEELVLEDAVVQEIVLEELDAENEPHEDDEVIPEPEPLVVEHDDDDVPIDENTTTDEKEQAEAIETETETTPAKAAAPVLPKPTTPSGESSKRLWGSNNHASNKDPHNVSSDNGPSLPTTTTGASTSTTTSATATTLDEGTTEAQSTTTTPTTTATAATMTGLSKQHLPFVPTTTTSKPPHATPPTGFSLAARVYTDPHDKLSHFDADIHKLALPYWDCGVTGSTTQSVNLQAAYIRHAMSQTTAASVASSASEKLHPVLVVSLTPVKVELNSGESQQFPAGSVLLLEDVFRPGHKLVAVTSTTTGTGTTGTGHQQHHADVQLLFLTLPYPYHQTGKEHVSLTALKTPMEQELDAPMHNHPCPTEDYNATTGMANGVAGSSSTGNKPPFLLVRRRTSSSNNIIDSDKWWNHPDSARWVVLTIAGLSVSTLAADFLAKTAPLWLAVGVGGTCFVTASTYSFCKTANAAWNWLQVWSEQRRLGADPVDQEDDDEKDDGDDEAVRVDPALHRSSSSIVEP